MKGYKGFSKDLKCYGGYQYEIGRTETTDKAELCHAGFHFCERPLDVFGYFSPTNSRYCEIEAEDVSPETELNDTKRVAKKLTVKGELGIVGLVKAQIEYVKAHCTHEVKDDGAATAGYCGAATAGYCGAATAGKYGAATAGDGGAATAGDGGAATAGYCGAATAGYCGAATAGKCGAATAGDRGAATAGYCGAATAGDRGVATAGDCGAATVGDCGAATAGKYGAATAGKCGAATAGDRGAATAGKYGAATAGDGGAATAGDGGAATAGKCGAATAGDRGVATAGKCGAATSRGSVTVGGDGCGLVRGTAGEIKIRGGMGAILVICAECEDSYDIAGWKAAVVDGETIKADTWYTLQNGKFAEVQE